MQRERRILHLCVLWACDPTISRRSREISFGRSTIKSSVMAFFTLILIRPTSSCSRGNRIGFVDFGATGRLSKEFRVFARQGLYPSVSREHRGSCNGKFPTARSIGRFRPASGAGRVFVAYQMYRLALDIPKANVRSADHDLLIDTMTIARRHKLLMPQELSIYYKTIMTVDGVLTDLAPDYDWLSDLPEFFTQGFISDVREELWRWPEVVMATKHRAGRFVDRCK